MKQETKTTTTTTKKRRCLMCRDMFTSTWAGERICKRCRSTAAWREGGNPYTGANR